MWLTSGSTLSRFKIRFKIRFKGPSPIVTASTQGNADWLLPSENQEHFLARLLVPLNPPPTSMAENLTSFAPLGVTASGVDWAQLSKEQKVLL